MNQEMRGTEIAQIKGKAKIKRMKEEKQEGKKMNQGMRVIEIVQKKGKEEKEEMIFQKEKETSWG